MASLLFLGSPIGRIEHVSATWLIASFASQHRPPRVEGDAAAQNDATIYVVLQFRSRRRQLDRPTTLYGAVKAKR
jgi:hypothetical protein